MSKSFFLDGDGDFSNWTNNRSNKTTLYDITSYGAIGDGIANDTISIQKAVDTAYANGGGVVFIPAKTFATRQITMKSGITIMGAGRNSRLLAHPATVSWEPLLKVTTLTNIQLENVTLDTNKGIVAGDDQVGSPSVWITDSTDISVINCTFQNNGYINILCTNSDRILVDNNTFFNSDCGVAVYPKPCNDMIIRGNYFDGAIKSEPISISCNPSGDNAGFNRNIIITNNLLRNHTSGNGITVNATIGCTVSNNIIQNCNNGVNIASVLNSFTSANYACYDINVTGNIILDVSYEGIILKDVYNSKIQGNTIERSGTNGIRVTHAENTSFVNNDIFDANMKNQASASGNIFSGLKNCKVSDNTFNIIGTNVTYVRHCQVIGSVQYPSDNNLFSDNICTNPSLYIFEETSSNVTNNKYKDNIGIVKTDIYTANGTKVMGNYNPLSIVTTHTILSQWGDLIPSSTTDFLYVDTNDTTTPYFVQGMNGSNSPIGRVITVVFKKAQLITLATGGTFIFRTSGYYTVPAVNTTMKFVWDGTYWNEIERISDPTTTSVPISGTWLISQTIRNSTPTASGYVGWVCLTTGQATNIAWGATTNYAVGDIVYAGTKVYKCTVAGLSGSSAPTFTSGTGVDGTVTWSYQSALATFKGYGLIQA